MCLLLSHLCWLDYAKQMPLRLALLGLDDDALALARAAAIDPRFSVALLCGTPATDDQEQRLVPMADHDPHWESLLLSKNIDAVVVARSPDRELRAEQLRKLVQAQIPLLVVAPACESIVGFEVDMIRRDTACLVLPYLPGGKHPALSELKRFVTAGDTSLGGIEQLVFERQLADRSRQEVLARLAQDAGLARTVVGNLNKVSAMGIAAGEPSLSNLSVNLSGPAGILVRWSVGPVETQAQGRISLVGAAGKAVLTMPADERNWRLEVFGPSPATRTWDQANGSAAALDELAQALATREAGESWLDACRDMELAETAERSALRGRTIELYQEEHSEAGTFKGVMSVGGCFMLTAGFSGLLVAFGVGGVQMLLRDPEAKVEASAWPLWLKLWPVYPFAAFLFLQLLQLVFRPAKKTR